MTGTYTVNGQKVSLSQGDFKAQGGEGAIYVKGHDAYKIYHDSGKMIPEGKILELSALKNLPNVLGPQSVIYKNNTIPVGFVMKYVKNTEFLCKLFTKGFRDKNGIDQATINRLVMVIQNTAKQIHSHGILIVDANELNFLVSQQYDNVYFIDVDSYKTPSYPASALMESVRDRKVKGNQFTELSDFFSLGCVMFQLYCGAHPYKGRHPDYSPKDWMTMMDKGISVFNKKCNLPPATFDLSVIPKGHLRWFEGIFEKGDRSIPPQADQTAPLGPVVAKIISGNDKFNIVPVRDYKHPIKSVRFIDGITWVISEEAIWGDDKKFTHFSQEVGYTARRTTHDLAPVQGDKPVWLEWNKIDSKLRYSAFNGVSKTQVGEIECNGFFVSNRCVYTVVGDYLVEVSFVNRGVKIAALQESVANIFHNHTVFDGLVVQNMLGTCRFAIPYQSGLCSIIHVKELDGSRIIDAKYDSFVAIVIAEKGGKYQRHTFIFDKKCSTYNARVEQDVALQEVNFAIKDNGVCIAENDDKLEIFLDNAKVKQVTSPLNGNEQIITFKNDTFVVNGNGLYKITSK